MWSKNNNPIPPERRTHYIAPMSFTCLLGRHRPMLASIVKRKKGYTALCDDCGLPIERPENGRWAAAEPLLARGDKAA
jgi:transcription elongation factor Elf1